VPGVLVLPLRKQSILLCFADAEAVILAEEGAGEITLTDLCYGHNAFWPRHLKAPAMDCDGFEVETLMSIRAAKAGLRIHEVPSYERPRRNGTSNLRAAKDGWRIPRVIAREKFGGDASPFVPRYQAAAAIGFPQPVRITGAEAKADAEVESL